MTQPNPDPHWSVQFPQLCDIDPRLDILRYERIYAKDGHPLLAFYRHLERALGRPLDLHRPGVAERSFDERWLLAVFDAASNADLAGYQFLLRSRMQAGDAARLHFALTQVQIWLEARL